MNIQSIKVIASHFAEYLPISLYGPVRDGTAHCDPAVLGSAFCIPGDGMTTTQTTAAPTDVQVRVFHNNHLREKYLRGYEPGQTVTEVFVYTTAAETGAPDLDWVIAYEAYRLFNVGDDPQFGTPDPRAVDYRARRNRSLSIGDVIAIDGRFLSCDSRGWSALTETPPIDQRAAHGTTPLG
ncbi:hypothetical protein [Umezawaea sp. Da 62-37]|uniref:hypothetical protein n=1 Tax=Umezawaea sp. Da 62-37 TaxID=3075927 RepID=UPI0028F74C42|nr:hypothetical protein [Umezawaea sp. Da 62-37]WNV83138.1 hypothetical protein RM788_33795 [Umezawaea sp. Da 62-37]